MATFRLAAAAEEDIVALLAWTEEHLGDTVRRRYEILLATGLHDIAVDPERIGSVLRPELAAAVRSYHLRHSRARARIVGVVVRRPRHLLVYRVVAPGLIGVGRVLHDSMELERYRPTNFGVD